LYFHPILSVVLAAALAVIPICAAADEPLEGAIHWNMDVPGLENGTNWPSARIFSLDSPDINPAGVNDWQCQPSSAHPEPVILVHGTWQYVYNTWNGLAPVLAAHGYCVFAPNYGNTTGKPGLNATGDLVASAREIAAFVARVRRATGAEHVALIGHSQGGAQIRYYANLLAPEGEVTKVIGLAASNHPTTVSKLAVLSEKLGLKDYVFGQLERAGMPGAAQQAMPESPFYVELNGHGETRPGIVYTNVATRFDELITPWQAAFIEQGQGARVDNILLQDVCAMDWSDHAAVTFSRNVIQIVLNKLDPEHARKLKCYWQAPVFGGAR
jgi:pimeloyl-ACP methyl ester carboxylesterase